jgi:hypothetical protein
MRRLLVGIAILVAAVVVVLVVIVPRLLPQGPAVGASIPAGWNTFRSAKHGFSVQYPASWTVKEVDTTGEVYFTTDERVGKADDESGFYYVFAVVFENPSCLPTEQVVRQHANADQIPGFQLTKKTIQAYTAYTTRDMASRSGMYTYLMTRDNTRFLQLSLTPYAESFPVGIDKYGPILDQMATTVQIDPSATAKPCGTTSVP